MADCLAELVHVLRSGNITIDEARVILQSKTRALRDFYVGAGVGAGVTWLAVFFLSKLHGHAFNPEYSEVSVSRIRPDTLATRKLNIFGRVDRLVVTGGAGMFKGLPLTDLPRDWRAALGAAVFTGNWRFHKSLHSCVQHILGLEGSRMQVELAGIMLRKYPNDEKKMELISKHFYPEKVFDDLTSQLKSVWRQRNFFVDSAADPVKTCNSDYGHNDVDVEPKQIYMNSNFVSMANPFDCVFGLLPQVEEMQPSVTLTSTKSPRKHRHGHKRSHRKHRVHNQEAA